MTKYQELNVLELNPTQLNWAVARCERYNPTIEGTEVWLYPKQSTMPWSYTESPTSSKRVVCQLFDPVGNWVDASEIMIREQIWFEPVAVAENVVTWTAKSLKWTETGVATDQLTAVMRCYVTHKVGPTITVPMC